MLLKRIDFSEPQKGKDQADRECAVFKAYMRNFVASGNNVLTALDLKSSILFRGGPKRTKVTVIEMNKNSKLENVKKITNVSDIHSISFHNGKMTLWRYFDISTGRQREITKTKLISEFSTISKFNEVLRNEEMTCRATTVLRRTTFFCPEFACDAVFDTEEELDAHVIAGKHKQIQARTSFDTVKSVYRELAVGDVEQFRPGQIESEGEPSEPALTFFCKGWAIPTRKSGRLDKDARMFVVEMFEEGRKCGKKLTADKIASKMRTVMNDQKEKRFGAGQYLTTKQIKSLIGRLAAQPNNVDHDGLNNAEEMLSVLSEVIFS